MEVGNWILLPFATFLIPLMEAVFAVAGTLYAQIFFKRAPHKYSLLIIQIATVGREFELVQNTINKIHSYNLKIPYQIWVVLEPTFRTDYQGADEIHVVPVGYECPPVDKARALHYCWQQRKARGLDRHDIKIMYVDDDTLPSKKYIELGFAGNYDIAQGLTIPNRWYGVGTFQHWLMSHMDDPRSRNCMVYCSLTQGILQKPIYVHGEGLTITGWTESFIGWDFHIVGSDDLVFGTNAAHRGLRWGYFNAGIQLVSPWTWKEHLKQRHRWTWGNLDAIRGRDILPLNFAIAVACKYLMGYLATAFSFIGIALLETGTVQVSNEVEAIFYTSLATWVISYMIPAWICCGGEPNRELRPKWWRRTGYRIVQTLWAVVLIPITAFGPMLVITYCLFLGRPDRFTMISKNSAAVTGI